MSNKRVDWLKVKHAYHCHAHGWWDAKVESGCPSCVVELRRELTALRLKLAKAEKAAYAVGLEAAAMIVEDSSPLAGKHAVAYRIRALKDGGDTDG